MQREKVTGHNLCSERIIRQKGKTNAALMCEDSERASLRGKSVPGYTMKTPSTHRPGMQPTAWPLVMAGRLTDVPEVAGTTLVRRRGEGGFGENVDQAPWVRGQWLGAQPLVQR